MVLARTTSSGGTSEPVGGRSPASTLSIVRTSTRKLRLPLHRNPDDTLVVRGGVK